jgi:WD40 repeat protein
MGTRAASENAKAITGLEFSKDGTREVSNSEAFTITVWDSASGTVVVPAF